MTWALLGAFFWGWFGSKEVHYCGQCRRQPLFWRVGMAVMWPLHYAQRKAQERRGREQRTNDRSGE